MLPPSVVLLTRNECQQTQSGLKQKSPHGDFCEMEFEGFPSTSGICATNTLLATAIEIV